MKRTMQFSVSAQQYSLVEELNKEPELTTKIKYMNKEQIEKEIYSVCASLDNLDRTISIIRATGLENERNFCDSLFVKITDNKEKLSDLLEQYNAAE